MSHQKGVKSIQNATNVLYIVFNLYQKYIQSAFCFLLIHSTSCVKATLANTTFNGHTRCYQSMTSACSKFGTNTSTLTKHLRCQILYYVQLLVFFSLFVDCRHIHGMCTVFRLDNRDLLFRHYPRYTRKRVVYWAGGRLLCTTEILI